MTAPIALQLYTVRESLAKDFAGTVRRVAEMGYAGVETAGFPGTSAVEAGKLFRELGLQVAGAHSPLPVGAQQDEVLANMEAIQSKRVISGGIGREKYATLASIQQVCETFNEAAANARARGLTFGIHNHWWEMQEVEGRWVFEFMLEQLDPDIFFEFDTYWIQAAGLDAAGFVAEYGHRSPLLHIKDGPAEIGKDHVALGEGVMDIAAVIRAGEATTEWLIVELDSCATDMMVAVERSYQYLVEKGLGHGR